MSKNRPIHRDASKSSSNFSAQHLLVNKGLIQELIRLANIRPADTVLDIGAGTGAITLPLAEKAANVVAIENDSDFIGKLSQKTGDKTNINIWRADFLQTRLPDIPFSVVANIPYSITTPILKKLLDSPAGSLQRAALIVEKGAAKRFTSYPITDPRILKWRIWFDIRMVRTISPDHFSPRPRVDSAILTICRRASTTVPPKHHLRFMALAVHGLRFPQLPFFQALGEVFSPPQIMKLARSLGIDRNHPICQLTELQWSILFMAMLQHVQPDRWPRIPKKYK